MRGSRPLLNGAEAESARREVRTIARSLVARARSGLSCGPSLLLGYAGPALFFGHAHLLFPQEGYLTASEDWIGRAVDSLAGENPPLGLFTGASGVGWVLHHLESVLGGDGEGDPTAAVTEALQEVISGAPKGSPTDFIHGLAGHAVFLGEKGADAKARRILLGLVDRLAAEVSISAESLTPEARPGDGETGVAHGLAGVLFALGWGVAAGISGEVLRVLSAGVERLLAHPVHEPRLSWCRGEIGVAATIAALAARTGEAAWAASARHMALSAASRPPQEAGIEDAGLCHGAAGLGHLLHRLYRYYGDECLATAARFWLAEAIRLRHRHPLSGGYPLLDSAPWDFLGGEAGTGLALLAALSPEPPTWDRLLGASY